MIIIRLTRNYFAFKKLLLIRCHHLESLLNYDYFSANQNLPVPIYL